MMGEAQSRPLREEASFALNDHTIALSGRGACRLSLFTLLANSERTCLGGLGPVQRLPTHVRTLRAGCERHR
jgi:hypothetical protein